MNKIILSIALSVLAVLSLEAQQKEKVIEKTILTYIENFFENDFEQMNEVLHPRLSKRGLNQDGSIHEDLPPLKLKEMLARKKALPLSKQQNQTNN